MATIYDGSTLKIVVGLPSLQQSDEAMHAAKHAAKERGEPVLLEDEGDQWWVHPDGDVDAVDDDN